MKDNPILERIAGRKLCLIEGRRYIASRPMADGVLKKFTITIKTLGLPDGDYIADVIDGLDYDKANEFLNEFNNEDISFRGRVWK